MKAKSILMFHCLLNYIFSDEHVSEVIDTNRYVSLSKCVS